MIEVPIRSTKILAYPQALPLQENSPTKFWPTVKLIVLPCQRPKRGTPDIEVGVGPRVGVSVGRNVGVGVGVRNGGITLRPSHGRNER